MSGWDRFVSTFLDPRVAERYLPDILAGVGVTVAAGVAIVVTGLLAGLALAVVRTRGWRLLNVPILVLVDVVRSLPPFVLLLIVFFGLPNVGVVIPAFVVLPQAVRLAIPPLTNRTIAITKNTALGSAIGVSEILGRATSAQAFSGNATPLTIGALLYLAIFLPLVIASRSLERRYGWRRA